jgi:hypothetical protein
MTDMPSPSRQHDNLIPAASTDNLDLLRADATLRVLHIEHCAVTELIVGCRSGVFQYD